MLVGFEGSKLQAMRPSMCRHRLFQGAACAEQEEGGEEEEMEDALVPMRKEDDLVLMRKEDDLVLMRLMISHHPCSCFDRPDMVLR